MSTLWLNHYSDVIMNAIASQITSVSIVYSIVCSAAHQRKHQRSTTLAYVRESNGHRWIPLTKCQQRGKCFHLMLSSYKDVMYGKLKYNLSQFYHPIF